MSMQQPDAAYQYIARNTSSVRSVASDDFTDLLNVTLEDISRPGLRQRLANRKKASNGELSDLAAEPGFDATRQRSLVKRVMETSGGDNVALARKIRERWEAAGLKQPSVEVRFENLTASAMVPDGSDGGLYTVGKDVKYKALGTLAAATMQKIPMKEIPILHGLSGVLKPGRMTLLLGPPAGGKSMLMKALFNQAPVPVAGNVTYNGHTFDEFNVTRTSKYVSQTDLHNPALTVRETLAFSARCQGAGYNRSLVQLLEEREAKLGITPDPDVAKLMKHISHGKSEVGVELVLQLLSLVNCADTIVGDGLTRGVSGGEKKRVTTGEMIIGPSKVLLMDEISTGLDSASTFTIVQSLSTWAHATDATIVVALLQPEPQTYDLFDDVMVLAEGRIVYHGERTSVEPHFASLGFTCPETKAVADYLQELVSKKDQPALRTDPSKLRPDLDFVPSSVLAEAFMATDMHKATLETLSTPFDKSKSHPGALMKSRYGASGWDMLKALFWREIVLLGRDRRAQYYRYFQMFVLSCFNAFLFLRDKVTTADDFKGCSHALSAIFFSVAYMQFLGLADCAAQLQRLPVFFKQRFNLFYPGWLFAIPLALVKLPIFFLEVTYWSFFTYWIVGLSTNAGRFFCFYATLMLLQMYSSSLFRLIGSLVRAIVAGTSVAVLTMLITFLGSGFVLLKFQMGGWVIWVYWLSPLQYTLTGLANNEFGGDDYSHPDPNNPSKSLGVSFLNSYGIPVSNDRRWIAPLVLFGVWLLINFANMYVLSVLPPPGAPPPTPPDDSDNQIAPAAASDKDAAGAESQSASDKPAADAHVVVAVKADTAKDDEADGLRIPFDPVTLAFSDVHYFVPNPAGTGELELLKGIYGLFSPGVLTALMGASGAGKSTLMDVLTDRKTVGRITGKVTVNGHEKVAATFARISGYCEQFDSHSPGTSVLEAVKFSAALRLSKDLTEEQHKQFVQHTMDIVELNPIAGGIVGIPGMYGLSGEQFKRLTIAVELVANPSIMFMDEPTSGLDARAAQIVMRVVRNIVNSNRTIVCTIHQPSAEIFHAFDEVLLLKRGGWTIYYGSLDTLVAYFQGVSGVKPMKPGSNPATYMLEVTTMPEEERLGLDFGALFEERMLPDIQKKVEPFLTPVAGSEAIKQTNTFATGILTQYKVIFVRNFWSYWRNPPYNTTRLLLTVIAALIAGAFYWSKGNNYGSVSDILAVSGALFVSIIFLGFVNFQLSIPVFLFERSSYYRERAARMYSVIAWVTAFEDVEIPWITVQSIIFSCIVYFMINFEHSAAKFFFFMLVVWLTVGIYTYLGMVVVAATPNFIMGVTFGALLQGLWFLFAGFLIPKPQMPHWLQWFYYLTPSAWSIYALVADQLGDKHDYMVQLPDGSFSTIPHYLARQYDYQHHLRWMAVGICAAYWLLMRLVLTAVVKYVNFQNR